MTIKLIVLKDGKPLDQFEFDQESVVIGRKSDSDISIKDPAVSGTHAKIQKVGDSYIIQDQGSTNGVHIRGRRIKQQVLQDEDLVTIGEHEVRITISAAAPPAAVPPASPSPSPSSVPGDRTARPASLEVVDGKEKGKRIPLVEGLTTVGEPGVQVAAISKRPQGHFIIHVDGGKDRERVPLVNGEAIGFKSRKLEDGDRIEVAGIVMSYHG
ncbi:MAG: FHA domain-containing protein [Pseudomonadales bacterium]|nr:FHA domain-containing protein [Pseudomonadales bacterium]